MKKYAILDGDEGKPEVRKMNSYGRRQVRRKKPNAKIVPMEAYALERDRKAGEAAAKAKAEKAATNV